jgi:hypothetical protein
MENTNLTSIDGIRLEAVVHPAQGTPSMGTVCDHGFGSSERQAEVIEVTAS